MTNGITDREKAQITREPPARHPTILFANHSTGYDPEMPDRTSPSDADILDRMIRPGRADMGAEAAQALLKLKFDADATKSIKRLLKANASGKITPDDRLLLDRYLRVGQLIDLIQAKARLSLSQAKA